MILLDQHRPINLIIFFINLTKVKNSPVQIVVELKK